MNGAVLDVLPIFYDRELHLTVLNYASALAGLFTGWWLKALRDRFRISSR
jgi:hypothetical protein